MRAERWFFRIACLDRCPGGSVMDALLRRTDLKGLTDDHAGSESYYQAERHAAQSYQCVWKQVYEAPERIIASADSELQPIEVTLRCQDVPDGPPRKVSSPSSPLVTGRTDVTAADSPRVGSR